MRRLLGAASVAAVAVGLLPVSPVSAAVSDICPGPGQTDQFTDDEGNVHEDNINCAAAYELVTGTTATTFAPNGNLTRGQAATILVNYVERATGTTLTTDATPDFTDTTGNVHAGNIEKAADNDIVRGFNDGTFRPEQLITRAQFATIAVQATERILGSALPTNATDEFTDDEGNVHESNIEKAADNGILEGTGANTFSPNANVTRGQTATIVIRAAGNVLFPAGRFAPRTGAQAFTVTPNDAAIVTLGGTAAASTRTYTATVPAGTVVDIELFAAANVTTAANGAITFVDADNDNAADPGDVTGAMITSVNGIPVTAGSTRVDQVTSTGTITFTVMGTDPVSVRPVVFADPADDDELTLAAATATTGTARTASDPFGVGGVTTFLPAEAPLGNQGGNVTVASVSTAADFFTSGTATFFWDGNDVFQFQGVGITREQFESAIASGAVVSVSYNPDPAGVSTFNIVQAAAIAAVGAPTVTVTNADAGATANDVRVTVTVPAGNPSGTTYVLQRAVCPAEGAEPTFTTVTTATQAPGTTAGTLTFSDNNVPNGCYLYRVTAIAPITGTPTPGAASGQVTIPGETDVAGPTFDFSRLTTTAGFANTFDAGDVITLAMSEPLGPVAAGDTLRLTDEDGTVGDIVNGTNATFSLNTTAVVVGGESRPAGTVLTVTLTGAPTIVTAGTVAGLQVPGAIIDAAGLNDVAGNRVQLDGDLVIEAGSIEGTLAT